MIKFLVLIFVLFISDAYSNSSKNLNMYNPPDYSSKQDSVFSDTLPAFTKRIYKVIKGDYLSKLAKRKDFYNDAMKWHVIFKANKDKIKDPNLIYPDQEFYIPIIEPEDKNLDIAAAKPDKIIHEVKLPLNLDDIEFQGFIVDETQSKWGKDFYEYYYNIVQTGISAKNFTIVVSEKPMPRLGSQISIKINDSEIFQQFIQPKQEFIEEIAQYGAEYTKNYIANYEDIEKNLNGEDLKGSGIY